MTESKAKLVSSNQEVIVERRKVSTSSINLLN